MSEPAVHDEGEPERGAPPATPPQAGTGAGTGPDDVPEAAPGGFGEGDEG